MAISLKCPNLACQTISSVANSYSGRNVRCKKCGTPFVAGQTLDGQKTETKGSASNVDPFPSLPAEFGRYRLLRLLGRGGMGSVYLAEDSRLGRQVALKFPAVGSRESSERAERFIREARSAAVLQHPNVCTIYDAGIVGDRPFISMAFVNGKPLDSLVDPDRPMADRAAALLVRKVALALAHAHEKGIVHRDLKPANVMMSENGEPVVMDFGLAKRVDEGDTNEAKLTRDGAVMGTPAYMAPEQVRGEIQQIGPATDVYALGVILFELLTGKTPYSGPLGVVMAQILAAPVPPASEFGPETDPRLIAVCQRAMAKNPAERFPSMNAFANALEIALDPASVSTVVQPASLESAPTPFSVFDTFDEDDRPRAAPRTRTQAKKPPVRPRGGVLLATLGTLVALGAIIIMTVRTKHGDVVIELSDPAAKVEVAIDGERIELSGLDRPLKLTAGAHGLTVRGSDFETVTESFTVKKGENQIVKVTLKPRVATARTPTQPSTNTPANPKKDSENKLPDDGWKSLFNGKDLAGWNAGSRPEWSVQDKSIYCDGRSSVLWTTEEFGDFELQLDYLTLGDGGVFFHGLEVQLTALQLPPGLTSTGAIYGVAAPYSVPGRPNAWHRLSIRALGSRVQVMIDGADVVDIDRNEWSESGKNPDGTANDKPVAVKNLKRSGSIGLQSHDGENSYRAVRIRKLDTGDGKLLTRSEWKPLFEDSRLTGWVAPSGQRFTDLKCLVDDSFDDAGKSGFGWGDSSKRFSDGRLRFAGNEGFSYGTTAHQFANFSCEIVARATDREGENGWGLTVFSQDSSGTNHGVEVLVSGRGDLRIVPCRWCQKKEDELSPFGPVAVPSYKPGEDNSLLVVVRENQLSIWINGVKACEPIFLKNHQKESQLQLAANGNQASGRLEFDSFTVHALPSDQPRP